MITPRIKPSSFFPEEAADDLFVAQQRKAKLEGYVQTLAAMDELIDFAAMAAALDKASPRADRSKGGRPPSPTEVLVCWCRTKSGSSAFLISNDPQHAPEQPAEPEACTARHR